MSPTKRTTRHRAPETVNINGMFDNARIQRQRKEREHRDVLAPRSAGITKSPAQRTGGFFKPFATSKGEDAIAEMFDPDYFVNRRKLKEPSPGLPVYGFAELTSQYMKAQDADLKNVQERHARSIAARRNGLLSSEDNEANGTRPWIPTEADINAVTAQLDELNRPIEDDILKIQWHQPNGAVTNKSERLSDVIEKLEQRIKRREVQLKELEKEHRKAVKEIESLVTDVQGESAWSKKADETFEAQIQALQDEIEQVEKSAKAELDKLKKEERAAAKKLSDKINELWDSIA